LSVKRRIPRPIKNTPPIIDTAFRYLEYFVITVEALETPAAMRRKGIASPKEKTARSIAP